MGSHKCMYSDINIVYMQKHMAELPKIFSFAQSLSLINQALSKNHIKTAASTTFCFIHQSLRQHGLFAAAVLKIYPSLLYTLNPLQKLSPSIQKVHTLKPTNEKTTMATTILILNNNNNKGISILTK